MRARSFVLRRHLTDAIAARFPQSDGRRGHIVSISATGLGLALVPAIGALAAVYVVDTDSDPGPALTTSLRQAVSQANASPGNVIEFAPALNGSTITLQQGEIAINQPMYIVGPGADKLAISGNDTSRIFNISTPSTTPIAVTLLDLTVSHGRAGSGFLGGAIYTSNVSLTLQDSVFESSYALQGGAIFLHSGNGVASAATLTRTTITNNSTKPGVGIGGGILAMGGATLTIVDSTISANTSGFSDGGGLLYDVGSTTIDNSRITGNHADTGSAGGLAVFHHASGGGTSSVTINNSTISGNSSALNGGGLSLINVVAGLTGDMISANSASAGGGMFVFDSTSPVATQLNLQRSSVTGNSASTFGGGIDVAGAKSVNIIRSLVAFNNAYDPSAGGGGVALKNVNTSASIDNSTIYGNYAYNNGGGVGIFDAATGNVTGFSNATIAGNFTFNYASNGILGAGTPTLASCIIASGSSHAGNQDLDGTFSISFSLIRTQGSANLSGSGNILGQDPQLGPLNVNGGPTPTMLPAATSPVLDAGDPSIASGSDQRGLPRVVNGRADMGAVERQYPEDVIFRNGFDSS